MIYFSDGQLTIRNMKPEDAQAITDAEIEQGWQASVEKYEKRIGIAWQLVKIVAGNGGK